MQVVSVIPLDKRRSKVLVDEGFAFVLYKGELRRYQIEEGCELAEEIYRVILDEVLRKRARERALYLLKASDKTEAELRRKLREGYYPEEAIDSAIAFLQEYHFIDDQAYGRRYIRTYGDSRSRKRLQFDLMQKGLNRDQIDALLEEEQVSEEAQVEAFLRRKGYDPEITPQKERCRLMMSLVRKGFSYDVIHQVMGESCVGEC